MDVYAALRGIAIVFEFKAVVVLGIGMRRIVSGGYIKWGETKSRAFEVNKSL
jgi:hypothetical protein